MIAKRNAAQKGIPGEIVLIAQNGFIDTTRGYVLSSVEALAAAQRKSDADERKRKNAMISALFKICALSSGAKRRKRREKG